MSCRVMVLPAKAPDGIRVVSIPEDIEAQEAYRHATGVISQIEESEPDYDWQTIEDALEGHGYRTIEFVLGPSLD